MSAEVEKPAPRSPRGLILFALVALGGILGGLARTGVLALAGPDLADAGLTAINVLGSGLLGLLVGAASPKAGAWLRPFAGTGVLGGFTTFSAAIATSAQLATGSGPGAAVGYLALSLASSVLAAGLGLTLGMRLARGGSRARATPGSTGGHP